MDQKTQMNYAPKNKDIQMVTHKSNNDVSQFAAQIRGNISFEGSQSEKTVDYMNLDFDGVTQNNMMEGNLNLGIQNRIRVDYNGEDTSAFKKMSTLKIKK